MKLVDLTIKDYLNLLKSDAPAPGGGSASALVGAQGCALFMMVANLTLQKKEKYPDAVQVCENAVTDGEKCYQKLVEQIDKDTEAFTLISSAYKMPKDTDEQKAKRSKAIQEGTLVATEVPFQTMKYAMDGMKIAKTMINNSNPNAASDLVISLMQLNQGIIGAWDNVLINLGSTKDESVVAKYTKEGMKILEDAQKICDENIKLIEI